MAAVQKIRASRAENSRKHYIFMVFAIICWILFAILLLLLLAFIIGKIYAFSQRNNDIIWGTTFSTKYTDELGLDRRQTYLAALDDLNISAVRLMSYWDQIEPINNTFDFNELDWQISEAKKRNTKVTLVVGLRQPRWPECHQPLWAETLQTNNKAQWNKDLTEYISTTILRYRNDPTISAFQIENEYLNRSFGLCTDFDTHRLEHEVALAKKLAPNKKIIVTTADQTGLPIYGPIGDTSGTSLYTRAWYKGLGYMTNPTPASWFGFRAAFTEIVRNKPMIISELQGEPWGAKATKDLSIPEQNKSMSEAQLNKNLQFAKNTGIKEIYTWGVEWWYWRKEVKHDPSLWNEAKETFKHN